MFIFSLWLFLHPFLSKYEKSCERNFADELRFARLGFGKRRAFLSQSIFDGGAGERQAFPFALSVGEGNYHAVSGAQVGGGLPPDLDKKRLSSYRAYPPTAKGFERTCRGAD